MNTTNATGSGPRYFGTAAKRSCFQEFDSSLPGPGAHHPHSMRTIPAPEWRIGAESNRLTFLDPHRHPLPSPQHYHVAHHPLQKLPTCATIPLSTYRPPQDCNDASYNPQDPTASAAPQFSFGYYQENDYSTLPPGPGAYETLREKMSHNRAQNGFSSSLRPPPYGEAAKFPGPSKYSIVDRPSKNGSGSFGRASKEEHRSHDPPARFYDLSEKKRTFKQGARETTEPTRAPSFIPKNEVPGPNVYHNELPHRIPNGVMEASKRTPIQYSAIVHNPSPDKYAAHGPNPKKGQSFTKQKRDLSVRVKTAPGPGAYEPMPTLSNLGGALPRKQSSGEEEQLPGAASYRPTDAAIRKKAASSVMLRSQRTDFSRAITGAIGPGEYNIANDSSAELGSMGRSLRPHHSSPNKNPGVGDYILPNFFGKLPTYCTSPKKLTEGGLSTLHEKMRLKAMQRQNVMRSLQLRQQKPQETEATTEPNPETAGA